MPKHHPNKLRDLWASTIALVSDWWRVDRVRVSPREGRLLRLCAPCVLRVKSELVEVERRTVWQSGDGPTIVYDCVGEFGPCQLSVTPIGRTHRPVLRWVQNGEAMELSEEHVEVY